MKKNIYLKDVLNKEEKKRFKKFSGGDIINFNKRIEYLNAIQRLLQKNHIISKSCLKQHKIKGYLITRIDYYYIGNIIKLYNTNDNMKGKYGIVYRADIIDKNFLSIHSNKYPIVAKVMENDDKNIQEVKLINAITNNIIKKYLSRHFLICYKSFSCENGNDNNKIQITRNDKLEYVNNYLVSLNELADGDLKQLLNKLTNTIGINYKGVNKEQLINNITAQCLLSIMTYHKIGWIHQDTHLGNFLYQEIDKKNGYYQYQILGKNYYIPNYGYTILLNDFGLSEAYIKDKKPRYFDHWNITFLKIINENTINNIKKEKISTEEKKNKINNIINEHNRQANIILNYQFTYEYNDYKRFLWVLSSNKNIYNLIQNNIISNKILDYIDEFFKILNYNQFSSEELFLKEFLNEMVKNNLIFENISHDEIILNSSSTELKPFIIDDTLKEYMPKTLPEFINDDIHLKSHNRKDILSKVKTVFTSKK